VTSNKTHQKPYSSLLTRDSSLRKDGQRQTVNGKKETEERR
jgi:hypothetical protein